MLMLPLYCKRLTWSTGYTLAAVFNGHTKYTVFGALLQVRREAVHMTMNMSKGFDQNFLEIPPSMFGDLVEEVLPCS